MLQKIVVVMTLAGMILGATVALADGGVKEVYVEDVGLVPVFDDGRLNAFDINAPAAIFAQREPRPVLDENGQQVWDGETPVYEDHLVRIEVWGYLPGTDTIGKVLEVTPADLSASLTSGKAYTISAYGYTLTFYPAASQFVLSAPAYGYSYAWQMGIA